MAKFQGVIGTQVNVTGNSTITIDDRIFRNATVPLWEAGCFGISVTYYTTSTFGVEIFGDLQGALVPIAGLSAIGSTTTTLIPMVNRRTSGAAVGTTETAVLGIPMPRTIVFGNSIIVGGTYAAVVSAMLWSGD